MQKIQSIKSKFNLVLKGIESPSSNSRDITSQLKSVYDDVKASEPERRQILEQTFRERIRDKVTASEGQLEEQDLDILLYLIDISIEALRSGITLNTTPFTLLSDLFDCLTIERCENLFTYIESNTETWMEPILYNTAKFYLLRTCNEFLRRLSRSQNTILCGRIQLFLARLFPMSEKSALNLTSQFNLANITAFGIDDSETELPKKIAEPDTTSSEKGKVDVKLYESLWGIQDFFRDPIQCYDQDKWRVLLSNTDVVLSTFKSVKLEDEIARGFNRAKCLDDGEMDTSGEYEESKYFTKFLTNSKLLELQLRDSLFRRHILLQYLILFQYIECSTKFKKPQQLLKKEQNSWIRDTKSRVYTLLGETPPNGEEFCEYVSKLLKREELWIEWKNEGCPPVPPVGGKGEGEKEEVTVKKEYKRKRKLGDAYQNAQKEKRIEIGALLYSNYFHNTRTKVFDHHEISIDIMLMSTLSCISIRDTVFFSNSYLHHF